MGYDEEGGREIWAAWESVYTNLKLVDREFQRIFRDRSICILHRKDHGDLGEYYYWRGKAGVIFDGRARWGRVGG